MKVFVGFHCPGLLRQNLFGKSVEVRAHHYAHAYVAEGCDAAIVSSPKLFDADLLDPDRRSVAVDEALRFAFRLVERDVKIVAMISPVAIPVLDVRRAFPDCYVSEHCHYVEPIAKDDDLARPFAIRWTHVWDRNNDHGDTTRHQHLFFFCDQKANGTDQPNWEFYLGTALVESERARDVSVLRGIDEIMEKAEARWKS